MEEKTGKIQKRKQSSRTMSSHDNDTSQSDHIPLDLTTEILSRLPAKSVVRFRSVSKLWSTITTSPKFINSFATRSLASRPSVLIIVKKGDMLFVFSSPVHKNSSNSIFSCVGSYQFTNPILGDLYHYYYVHGLIFLEGSKQLVIWNPTVKRFFTLPEPEGTQEGEYEIGCILGYDPIDRKYIVLRFLRDSKICILTLGAQGQVSRRIITNGIPKYDGIQRSGECINGVMYYLAAFFVVGVGFENRLVSFNVRSEKFNLIKFPEGCRYLSSHMVPYEGRLALVSDLDFPYIDLWILKNGDRHEWTHKRFVLPCPKMYPFRSEKHSFYGVSDAGELIFAQWKLSESFYILYFDSRKNIIREVLFEGTLGDEFRLVDDYRYFMNVYPNHIESLVSL